MTAIEAIGFSFFVMIVLALAVTLVVITRSIHQEETRWSFSATAPSRSARMTRRMLGAYCDPGVNWTEMTRPEPDRAGQTA